MPSVFTCTIINASLLPGFQVAFEASKYFYSADMAVDDITFPGCALAPIRPCQLGEFSCARGSCVLPSQVGLVTVSFTL